MKKEIGLSEVVGKTVSAMCGIYGSNSGEQFIIVFNDDTFICLGIEHDYDQDHRICVEKIELLDFGDDALVKIGVCSYEEIQKVREQLSAKRLADQKDYSRRYYEQFKREFEPK